MELDSALVHFRVNVRLATLHHPSCSVVTNAARTGCAPNNCKAHHPVNHKAPSRKKAKMAASQCSKLPVWTQNDQFFASLVECVLRWSFSKHWRKNGVDPRPTTYESRRPTRQGQTVELLSVRGPGKEADLLVGALPERLEPRK